MRRLLAPVAAACLLALAGCGGPPPAQTHERLDAATFRVGLAQVSRRDSQIGRAAALAAEQVNEKGGAGGAVRIEIVTPDEAGEPADVARRLVQRGVNALVLSCEPDAAPLQAEVAQRTEVLAFQPCVDDPALSSRYPNLWPVSLPANAEAAALADFALSRGYRAAAVVGDAKLGRYFEAAAPKRDIATGGSAGVTVWVGGGTGVPAARPLLGTHLLDTEAFAESPGAEGVAFTTYGFPTANSAAGDFYAAWTAKYGVDPPGSWVTVGYDAIRVLAQAIDDGASADPDAIGERIGRGLTVQGGVGEITYPGAGEHLPETPVAVVEVRGGRRVLLEKSLPEDVPSP